MITQEDIDDIQFNLGLLKLVRDGKYEIGVGIPKESKFRKILARFIENLSKKTSDFNQVMNLTPFLLL